MARLATSKRAWRTAPSSHRPRRRRSGADARFRLRGRSGRLGRLDRCEQRRPLPLPEGPQPRRLPGDRAADPRALGRRPHLRGLGGGPPGRRRVRLLRRPALRQRPPPLRPPPHRLRQGRRPPLPDHARTPRRAPLRLGHPRPAGRDGGGEGARDRRATRPSTSTASPSSTTTAARSVLRYTAEWERYVNRMARWVDFEDDYKTMDLPFMESVIWAFKRLWDKGLIYEAYRVLPYSWGAETPLSNFEIRLDDATRPRQDPALTVAFDLDPADGDPGPLGSWPGRPHRGRCRPTWPSPSGPTSTTRSSRRRRLLVLAQETLADYAAELGEATTVAHPHGHRPGRPHLRAALPVLRRQPRQLPGPRRRLPRHRRGHRRGPPGSRLR